MYNIQTGTLKGCKHIYMPLPDGRMHPQEAMLIAQFSQALLSYNKNRNK